MKELSDFIKSQISIEADTLDTISSHFKERKVAKDKFVLKAGHIATNYIFVKSGGLRIYFDAMDKQVTGWIALENEFLTDLSSLNNQTPSRFNIQAIEDTEILTISKDEMNLLYKKFPIWQEFGRKVWETAFLKTIEGIISFQIMSAEERYKEMMEHSDLLQRIPLKDLSSYLGITPNSLSRIRKNIR